MSMYFGPSSMGLEKYWKEFFGSLSNELDNWWKKEFDSLRKRQIQGYIPVNPLIC